MTELDGHAIGAVLQKALVAEALPDLLLLLNWLEVVVLGLLLIVLDAARCGLPCAGHTTISQIADVYNNCEADYYDESRKEIV